MSEKQQTSDAEKAADIIGEIVANSLFSDTCEDVNGDPAGIVDGLYAIARSINLLAHAVTSISNSGMAVYVRIVEDES